MLKILKGKNVIVAVFVLVTVIFVTTTYGLYDKIIDGAKKDSVDMYSSAVNVQYELINDDLSAFEKSMRDLNNIPDFAVLSELEQADYNADYLSSAWQVYLNLSNAVQNNKYIADTYIVYRNNDIQISNKKVIAPEEKDLHLSINSYKDNTLRVKCFSTLRSSTLLYSDSVHYNGKSEGALLYCVSPDGGTLSGSDAICVAVIPLSKIYNLLKFSSVLKNQAEIAIYSGSGFAYQSANNIKVADYTVIDCDENRNFSWSVYIKNKFFSHTEKYYRNITLVFVAYAVVVILFILFMAKDGLPFLQKRAKANEEENIKRELEVNLRISRLFVQRPDEEEIRWFRENASDFPRPCIAALFKAKGIDSVMLRAVFEQMGVKIRYVSSDASGHPVAFFDYRPDGECTDEIKNILLKFIENYKSYGINPVISLSNPCMDVDEIYDACMSAAMMFKYNEYDNLICAGDVPSDSAFSADDYDNDKILRYILAENAFEANKIIYGQWYELSQHPSFGDEIEQLFVTQIGILASAAVKAGYENELPKYDSRLSVTELAFLVTGAAEDIAAHITERQSESLLYNDVIAYIDDNFTNPDFSQPDIKEKFNISTKMISKILKQKKNMLFSEYLESLRIGKARYILAHSDIKICDISKMCGYGTNDAFYKAFNKKEGTTPGAYRRANVSGRAKKGKASEEPMQDNSDVSEE